MIARVGADLFGPATIENFKAQGIGADHVRIVPDTSSGVAPIFVEPGGQIFFALLGGKAVGTCALIPHGPRIYELAKMAVSEELRGRGIGGDLLAAAIES